MIRGIAACVAALAFAAMPAKAATIFQEAGGRVVIEAEHFTSRTSNADGGHWQVVPDEGPPASGTPTFANARGSYVSSQPDSNGGGLNHNGATDAIDVPPFIDYKVNIATAGEYQIWMRWGGYDGSSDSIYAQIVELNASEPRWYRFARSIGADFLSAPYDTTGAVDDNTAGGNEVPAVYTLTPGTYTIRITQREDGSALDTIVFQLSSMADPGNPGPPESDLAEGFVIGAPSNAVALPPNTATFNASAKAAAGVTITYQWQSKAPGAANFADVAGATSASYTTPPTTVAMNGTQYRVLATSGGTTLTSAAATLITDNTPPALLHAFSGPAPTTVTLQFSEKLDPASVTLVGNYPVTGGAGLTVTSATLAADGKTVYLKTSAQTPSTQYTITVNGVKDVPGNVLNGASTTFKGPVAVPGQLLVRKFENIAGTAVDNLINSPLYPDVPASVSYWTAFGGTDIFPGTGNNMGANFGLEITGFIIPSVTADYVFYISSDDASRLYLSTDESPANAALIAQEGGCCNQFTYQPGRLSSAAIHLEQGKSYYTRGYLKEGGGGDFITVTWKNTVTDGDPTVAPIGQLDGAIPTDNLATGYDPSGSVTITTPPANLTVPENAPWSFKVVYNAYSPLLGTVATVQWQSAPSGSSTFTDVPGATSTTLGGTFAKAAQSGTQYRVVVTSGDVVATSTPATLTVSGSVPLVTLTKTIEQRYFNNVTVNNIAALRSDPRFPNNPTSTTFEPLFEFPRNGANEGGANYGNRLSGWLNPPEDGVYVFFVCADDPGELWLSTDDDPANKKLIATEINWSGARSWNSSGGGSDLTAKRSDQFANSQWPIKDASNLAVITLQKGKHYYMEALHTEGGGGDNIGVAWKTPSGTEPADLDPAISSDYIDQLFAITGTVTFGTQPANTSAAQNTSATFTAAATASDGSALNYIWQSAAAGSTDFQSVGTGTSYTTPLLTAGDNGRQYRVVAFSPSGAGLSTVATLAVTSDNVPPTITYFTANRTSALLVFSEPVDAITGAALTSYSIAPGGSITAATVGTTPGGLGTVTLALSGLTDLVNYTITIKNVKDTATPGNTIVQTTKSFVAYDINADFNGPVPPPKATLTGTAKIVSSGSFDGSGWLELTPNVGNSQGTIGIDDMLAGETIDEATKVTAKFKLFIGNGSGNPADGFSFNVASDIDPATVNTGEEGTGSGLTIAFDTYDNGGAEAPAIDVKWGGAVIATTVGSTTPVTKPTLVNNQWVDVFIQYIVDTTGAAKVTVVHNNVKYYDNLDVPGGTSIPTPKVALGGRTGGEFERNALDNVVVIYNVDVPAPQPPTISITSPANNAELVAGTSQTITVNAVASEGVNKVEFYANGQLLGQSTTAPYSFTLPGAAVVPGIYSLTAKITDNAGVAVTSAAVNVIVRPPASANAKKVLFVHATGGPNASNIQEANHLFGLGYDVYMAPALPSVTTDADGKALVMISSTVGSGDVADKFLPTATPVLFWENALEDNFLLTLNGGTDHATTAGQTSIDILPSAVGNKLAAGLSGNVVVTTAATDLSWGLPTSSATQIATIAGNTAQTAIYAVEPGGTLIDGASKAAGRRVYFMLADSTFPLLTANGLKLFDAAIDYAVNGPGGTVNPATLTASVANNNLTITWTNGGTLEWKSALSPGAWTSTGDTDGSYSEAINTAQNKFFRVRNP